jgi:hypothetical protein
MLTICLFDTVCFTVCFFITGSPDLNGNRAPEGINDMFHDMSVTLPRYVSRYVSICSICSFNSPDLDGYQGTRENYPSVTVLRAWHSTVLPDRRLEKICSRLERGGKEEEKEGGKIRFAGWTELIQARGDIASCGGKEVVRGRAAFDGC